MILKFKLANENDKEEFIQSAINTNPKTTVEYAEKMFDRHKNITLNVLRDLKVAYKWADIEEMGIYIGILQKVKDGGDKCSLNDSECDLIKKVCKAVAKDGKITGYGLEQFVEFYNQFKL